MTGICGQDLRRRRPCGRAASGGDERQDRAVLPGEDLAVEDPVPGQGARRVDDLRELAGDVVEVAGEQADVAPRLWSWARIPSYLSSTQTSGPSRRMISSASSAGEASMNLSGWKRVIVAAARRSSRASVARRPMSPVSIPAHFTSSSGRSNAFAIAASSRPSRSPMRSSPPSTLTMYLAVSGSARASSSRRIADLRGRAGRRLDRRERGGDLGERRGGPAGSCPAPSRTSCDGEAQVGVPVVGGAERDRGRRRRCSATVVTIADQPRPAARWSASGNGRPVRKTAAIGSSSGVRARR